MVCARIKRHQIIKRFDACVSLLSWNSGQPFSHRIVTFDEKWVLYDNRRCSASWLDKDEVSNHSSKPNINQKKLMVTAWSSHGLIHYCFIKLGQSIIAETYCNQLDNMIKNLAEKKPRILNRDRPIFLHDNSGPHTANRTQ